MFNLGKLGPHLCQFCFIGGLLRQLWTESGGAWTGGVREGPLPPGARLLHTLESPPLAEVVRDTNKFSNNIMARHLFLTLGAESAGPPADARKSLAALKAWLAAKKIAAPELVMENGSGLSRIERISAASLGKLLQAASNSGRRSFFRLLKLSPCVSQVAFASGAQEIVTIRVPASIIRRASSTLCP